MEMVFLLALNVAVFGQEPDLGYNTPHIVQVEQKKA